MYIKGYSSLKLRIPDCHYYIQFIFNEKRCALYEDKLLIAPFKDRETTIEFIGKLIHYLNKLHDRKNSIIPDSSKYVYIPVLDILKRLPRTNCKKCGFESCTAFAAAVSKGENMISNCPDQK
jgi:ArsR family metal-binding transcriptional regulator